MLVFPRLSTAPRSTFAVVHMHFSLKLRSELNLCLYHSFTQLRTVSKVDNVVDLNKMVTKLCKEGQIAEARHLFDKIPDPDVIAWTSIISSYMYCGKLEEAGHLFHRADAKRNVVTWTAMVNGYIRMKHFSKAEKLFYEMPQKNVVSWNIMISGYVQNGRIDSALSLFKKMPEKNIVSCNTIIAALCQCGRIEEARKVFSKMAQRNVISWTSMVAGLSRNGDLDKARAIFDMMPERNVISWNAIITGYAQNLRMGEAVVLFEKMPTRDITSWNTMITGFIQSKNLERARELFDEMPCKNVISWTTMITGYAQSGESEEALRLFSKMQGDSEIKSNEGTFVSVLSACTYLAGLCEGQQIHQTICKTVYQNSEIVVSSLINMYSKCGELGSAKKMFDGCFRYRDLVSWNVMLSAYSHHGCGNEAINLFKQMQNLGIKPNDITYVALLSACSHGGLVEQGLMFFDELVKDKSVQVRDDHYTCLVDLCGRAGRLVEAFDFIQRLQIEPSSSAWAALLAGCNVHGNSDIGKLVSKKVLEVEPENASTYMLLSNIYASSGKWGEAAKLRSAMKDKGLKKQPGCSWVDVENKFHVFIVGDKSHPRTKIIHSLLGDLHWKMRRKLLLVASDDFLLEDDIL